jgi:hypothetical protein
MAIYEYITIPYIFFRRSKNWEKAAASFVTSVCPSAWKNSAPTRRIFTKFCILIFFENLSRKFEFHKDLTGITLNYTNA